MKLLNIFEDYVPISTKVTSNVKVESDIANDKINEDLLKDIDTAAKRAGVVVTITTAKSDHSTNTVYGTKSRHSSNDAVDIAILNGKGSGKATNSTNGDPEFRRLGNKLKNELVKMGYNLNGEGKNLKAVIWQSNIGGNHFNHLHVSNKGGGPSSITSSETGSSEEVKTGDKKIGLGIFDKAVGSFAKSVTSESINNEINRFKDLI